MQFLYPPSCKGVQTELEKGLFYATSEILTYVLQKRDRPYPFHGSLAACLFAWNFCSAFPCFGKADGYSLLSTCYFFPATHFLRSPLFVFLQLFSPFLVIFSHILACVFSFMSGVYLTCGSTFNVILCFKSLMIKILNTGSNMMGVCSLSTTTTALAPCAAALKIKGG